MATQPTPARCQGWESVKSDVHQIYIVQKKTLEATRTAIQARHGFERRSVGQPLPYTRFSLEL
jgi:hypothetical protein